MAKLGAVWVRVRESLWFVPGVATALAIGLAYVTIRLDEAKTAGPAESEWLFGGGAEGALNILGSIVTSLITVTGVTFSVTIVALQLASSQYTPRVLRNFTADRSTQLVLGVFIATFTYALLIQRRVRLENEDVETFVPSISVTVAVLLVLVSVGFLIYFIDHMARSIQASVVIDRAAKDALALVDKLFPERVGRPARSEEPVVPEGEPLRVAAGAGGYLQAVDDATIFDVAANGGLTIRMEVRIGDFVLPEGIIASVWPRESAPEETVHRIRAAFVLGPERTLQQDAEHGIIELVDIAVKALSPSINDPETAKNCMDRLGEILAVLGNREFPARVRADGDGRICLIARRMSYDEAVDLAFHPIRHYGAGNPGVAARLILTLGRLAAVVPAARRPPLARQLDLVVAAARAEIPRPGELEPVERAAAEVAPLLGVVAPVARDRPAA